MIQDGPLESQQKLSDSDKVLILSPDHEAVVKLESLITTRNIQELDLTGSLPLALDYLRLVNLKAIANFLAKVPSIKTLKLCSNALTDIEASYFIKCLKGNKHLISLDLSDNSITENLVTVRSDYAQESFCEYLQDTGITVLGLGGHNFTQPRDLIFQLRDKLEGLDLSNNKRRFSGAQLGFLDVFARTSIRQLNLSGSIAGGWPSFLEVVTRLQGSRIWDLMYMLNLKLSPNWQDDITSEYIQMFVQAIKRTQIAYLGVEETWQSADFFKLINLALAGNIEKLNTDSKEEAARKLHEPFLPLWAAKDEAGNTKRLVPFTVPVFDAKPDEAPPTSSWFKCSVQ